MEIREYENYSEKEILELYKSVGWISYTEDPEKLKKGFENSLSVLAAYENDSLLGIIRVCGDGETIVYIQDILVFPEYQRQGVGTCLAKAIISKFESVRQIVLITDSTEKTVSFYRSLGFGKLEDAGCCGFMLQK